MTGKTKKDNNSKKSDTKAPKIKVAKVKSNKVPNKKTKTEDKQSKKDSSKAKPSVVDKGNLVSVQYVGTLSNGEVFDNSDNNGPISFIVGASQVIKGFDDAVVGMKINDKKKFSIKKEEAYGDINPALMHKVPLDKLPPEMKSQVKVGGFLVLQSPVGQQIPAKVHSITDGVITLDLNHPLAGKDLTFDITIVDIDVPDESHTHSHDHAHGHDHNHDSCCGDDDCGDDCECGDDKEDCCGGDCDCK
jgi:peptidylprolyl isomerase